MTQNNLGNVLSDLGERSAAEESTKYLQDAVAAYENALTIFTPSTNPSMSESGRDKLARVKKLLKNLQGRSD